MSNILPVKPKILDIKSVLLHITTTSVTCNGHDTPFVDLSILDWVWGGTKLLVKDDPTMAWPRHVMDMYCFAMGMVGTQHFPQHCCGWVVWVPITCCGKAPCIHYLFHIMHFIRSPTTIATKVVVKDDPTMTQPLCSVTDMCILTCLIDIHHQIPHCLKKSNIYNMPWYGSLHPLPSSYHAFQKIISSHNHNICRMAFGM